MTKLLVEGGRCVGVEGRAVNPETRHEDKRVRVRAKAVVVAAGVSPIHFGIVIVLNMVIGALTPPLGVLLFTTARVGGADQAATFRAAIPFVFALIVVLMIISYVPALTMLPVEWFGP